MENMNLASRCREAITHVAMLKKELSVQQRRYEEAVKGGAAISTPGGPGATPISLPASPAATPELATPQTPRTVSQVTPTSASRTPTSKQQTIRPGSSEKVPTPAGSNVAAARGRWEAQQQRQQQEAAAGNGLSANASEAGASRVRQDDLFGETTRNTQPHLPSTPEKEDVVTASFPAPSSPNSAGMRRVHKQKATDIEMERPPAAVFSNATMVKARTEMSTMSSIDAFEASFASTFPASFSSSKVAEGPAPSLDIAFDVPDFSDPFYLGSEKDAGGLNFPETSNGRANGRSAQPVVGNGMGRSRAAPSPKKTRGSGNQLFPSSPMRAINHGQGEGASGYGAGSSRSHVTPAMGVSDNGASPSAPEKAGASGSPRVAAVGKQAEISPASSESRRELSNSASIVLKRLQQRREKYKGGNASPPDATLNGDDQPDSTPGSDYGPKRRIAKADNSWQKQNNPAAANRFRSPRLSSTNKLSPSAMSAEMNELDAIAAQVGASSAAAGSVEIVVSHSEDTTLASNRRPVRNGAQPASYAEPPLNTKVRKGHEFFPKKEQAMA